MCRTPAAVPRCPITHPPGRCSRRRARATPACVPARIAAPQSSTVHALLNIHIRIGRAPSPPCTAPAAPAAAHAAAFCALWASEPGLSAAIALNWALGRLSLGKWGLLLALAITGRMWMYWTFQACKLVDRGLAKIAPPIRRFFWWAARRPGSGPRAPRGRRRSGLKAWVAGALSRAALRRRAGLLVCAHGAACVWRARFGLTLSPETLNPETNPFISSCRAEHRGRANFLLWMIYLVLSPSHLYPIPIWPFTPGAFGPQEAFQ
jgi:hypothetical protein